MSFTDSNIGRLLAEVDTLHLSETTVVAIMGDHVRCKSQSLASFAAVSTCGLNTCRRSCHALLCGENLGMAAWRDERVEKNDKLRTLSLCSRSINASALSDPCCSCAAGARCSGAADDQDSVAARLGRREDSSPC